MLCCGVNARYITLFAGFVFFNETSGLHDNIHLMKPVVQPAQKYGVGGQNA